MKIHQRRYDGENRKVWNPFRRAWMLFWKGVHKFLIHPFLDANGYGSMPAWMAFGLCAAMIYRLLTNMPVGWPDAIIILTAFLGMPLYEAAVALARSNPEALLTTVISKYGVGAIAQFTPHKWKTGDPDEGDA